MKRLAITTLTAAGASVLLLGGAALAAMAPDGAVRSVTPDHGAAASSERGKPPLGKVEEVLAKLVADGRITAAQRDAVLEGLRAAAKKAPEARAGWSAKHALARATTVAAEHLGLEPKALAQALRGGKSLAELATEQGKTRESLIAAIVADANARIDEAAAAGKLTAEQAAKAKADVLAAAAKLVDAKREKKAGGDEDDKDKDGKRERKEASLGGHLKDTRAYLGVDAATLQRELRAGKSLAEIAVANGKTREGLIAATVAPVNTKVDAAVASGKLGADAAAKAKAKAAAAAAKVVDAKRAVKASTSTKRP